MSETVTYCASCGTPGAARRVRCSNCDTRLDLGNGAIWAIILLLAVASSLWRAHQGASPGLAAAAGTVVGVCAWWVITKSLVSQPRNAIPVRENWRKGAVTVFVSVVAITIGAYDYPEGRGLVYNLVVTVLSAAITAGLIALAWRQGWLRGTHGALGQACRVCAAPSSLRAAYCWSCGEKLRST